MAGEHRGRGRPRVDKKVDLLLRVDKDLLKNLDDLAKIKGISRNRLSVNIISDYVYFYLLNNNDK